jgi:hypothetical protein
MRAFVYVFLLLFSIVAAVFEATKMAAFGPQRNRNVNKRTRCIVVDQDSLMMGSKIRYYKDVTLCENYIRDFFIAAILPVSVKLNAINL